MTAYIYGIHIRDSDHIRYVGKTVDPETRFRRHIRDFRRNGWFRSSGNTEKDLAMTILEICENADPEERETYWICHLIDLGHQLENRSKAKLATAKRGVIYPSESSHRYQPAIISSAIVVDLSLFYRSISAYDSASPEFKALEKLARESGYTLETGRIEETRRTTK